MGDRLVSDSGRYRRRYAGLWPYLVFGSVTEMNRLSMTARRGMPAFKQVKRNMGGHHEIPTEGIDGAVRKVFPKDWQVCCEVWC